MSWEDQQSRATQEIDIHKKKKWSSKMIKWGVGPGGEAMQEAWQQRELSWWHWEQKMPNHGLAVYTLTSELTCSFTGVSSSQGIRSLSAQCAWTLVVVRLRSKGHPALFFLFLLSLIHWYNGILLNSGTWSWQQAGSIRSGPWTHTWVFPAIANLGSIVIISFWKFLHNHRS